jgi:hypothetical protein
LRRRPILPRIVPHPRREPSMSLMEKIKSMFSGGSSDTADAHAEHDHDHAGHDHSHEPAAPPMPQADVTVPTPERAEESRPD